MDAISIIVWLFLNFSCDAQKEELREIHGQTYQVLAWSCTQPSTNKHHLFRVWARQCPANPKKGEATWWSRPFLLEEMTTGKGLYMNRFAEIHAGDQVQLDDTYFPDCVS